MSVTIEELEKQVNGGNYSLLKKDPVFQKAVKEVANIISKGNYTEADVSGLQEIDGLEDSDKLYNYANAIPVDVIESIVGDDDDESDVYMYIGNCIVATGALQALKSQDAQSTLGAKLVEYGLSDDEDEASKEVKNILDNLKDWEVK